MKKGRFLQALSVVVVVVILLLSSQDGERASVLVGRPGISDGDPIDSIFGLSAGPGVISVKADKETAYYGMADDVSVRELAGYADYVVCAHALYNSGGDILDNVRYLHDHGTKIILDMCWWDVWPLAGAVNGWPEMYKENIVYGMNATESVKYRIRQCLDNIGPEYVYGITIGEEEGPPSGFPGEFVVWYLNLFYDWMRVEFPNIKVFQYPSPYTWILDPALNLKADGIVVDDYSQELDVIGTEAELLKEAYRDADLLFFVSAVENFGWFTAHTPTYLKQAVDTVLEYAKIVGFWVTDDSGNEGWEVDHWMYNVSLEICNQIHAYSVNTVYADTSWFPDQFGNDSVTESLDDWYGSSWKDVSSDPDLTISTSSDRIMGDFSISLARSNTGTKSFWWQPVTHVYGLPDYPTAGPYGVFNISGASRIRYFVKGVGWDDKADPQAYISLEKYNSYFLDGNLTLPDVSSLLVDGQWHEVIVSLPLPPEYYYEWDGYASQIRIITSYSSGSTPCSILFDGWEIQALDAGRVVNLTSVEDYVRVDDGALYVEGNAVLERIFEGCEGWYYGYSGTGQIEFLINGTWEAAPPPGDPVYEYLGGFRLYGGSFDYIQINALPPLVRIDSPISGDIVSRNVLVEVSASDSSGIADVVFSIDGVDMYSDNEYPYEWFWDTRLSTDGPHLLNVTAASNNGSVNYDYCYPIVDNTRPSVTIEKPGNGVIVNDTCQISVEASDLSGIASVEFYVDGILEFTDNSAPYEYLWDTDTTSDGLRNITCLAADSVGNTKSASVLVTVDNSGPLLSIHSLSVWGSNGLMAVNTSDPSGIDRVEFCLDDMPQYIDYIYPYEWHWSNLSLPDGCYAVSVLSYDISNHSSTATSGFEIDNTLPSLSVTLTPSGTVLGGSVTVTAVASDSNGIACVEFYLDGILQHTDYIAPYAWSWDTTLTTDGSHSLTVITIDNRGNSKRVMTSPSTDNTGPSVFINNPMNETALSGPSAVTVTVQDASAVDVILLSYNTGSGWTNISMVPSGNQFEATLPLLQPGDSVQVHVFANDTLGNGAWSVTFTYHVVDTTSPTLSVVLTPGVGVLSGPVHVGVTATDISNISMVILYVDASEIVILEEPPFEYLLDTNILPDGLHTLRIWTNDTWDNSDYLDVMIQTDNSGPTISVSAPANGTVYDAPARVCVEASIGDPHGLSRVSVLYTTGGSWITESMVLCGSKYIWNSTSISSGTIIRFIVAANDTLGNERISEVYECSVMDLSGPTISIPSLVPKAPTSFDTVTVSVSVSDHSGVGHVALSFSVDSGPWINITMTLNSVYWVNIPAMSTGSVINYRVYANDSLGHWTSTPIYEYTVVPFDVLPPDVFGSSWVPTTPNDTQVVEVRVNATDPSGVTIMTLAYHDGSIWHNVTMVLSAGQYIAEVPSLNYGTIVTLKVYACDGQGNWGVTPLGSYTVVSSDLEGPEVVLLNWSPSDPTEENTVEVYAQLSDANDISSVLLCYGWGTVFANTTMTFNGTGYVAIIGAHPIGAQVNLSIYSCDNRDNWAVGEWTTYAVRASDITPPTIGSITWSPSEPFSNESIDVYVVVSDENGVDLVLLDYFDGSAWRNLTMTLMSSDPPLYLAQVPALGLGGTIAIWVLAWDSKGNLAWTDYMAIEVQQVPPTTTLPTTPPTSTALTTDDVVTAVTGALVFGVPAGIAVGLGLSRSHRKGPSAKPGRIDL